MILDSFSLTWSHARSSRHFEIRVVLFDTLASLQAERAKFVASHKRPSILGTFLPAAPNGPLIGTINLSAEALSLETIIHECMHAAIEHNYHLGRHFSRRYEEPIVQTSGELSTLVLATLAESGYYKGLGC